ncbi:MAG: putative ribonuclease [Candidatus Saccharibacteria bacterium]|nr:putative ribonuclease [Candidatus Saccharibacteria bacterium]
MNAYDKTLQKLDRVQREHFTLSFLYAVVKKYGEDRAGTQAALLTYYGFLSLFPLLLVLTTVLGTITNSHSELQRTVIDSITSYFPGLGTQLSQHVHTLHRAGLALIVGLLFTFYGTRGVADAFQNGVNDIWSVPRDHRTGFPLSIVKNLTLIIVGGIGFSAASIISTYAAAFANQQLEFKLLSGVISVFILFWVFLLLIKLSLPGHIRLKQIGYGAATAAILLVVVQTCGGLILTHVLKNLDALYSSFSIALGLLFWIYLQAQVMYFSVEVATVEAQKLWPRSLSGKNCTVADERVKVQAL